MRVLAVSHTPIWPIRSGAAIRRSMTLNALGSLGSVDLLMVGEVEGAKSRIPAEAPVQHAWEMPARKVRPALHERLAWLLTLDEPIEAIEWDRRKLAARCETRYDVVWYFRPVAYALAGRIPSKFTVVDYDDLEDDKIRLALAHGADRKSPLRRRLTKRLNAIAWHHYQHSLATEVDAVVLCSDEDRKRLGAKNCYVVPNGYPDVASVDRNPIPSNVILFVGTFDYEPNADAAEFFVRQILPLVIKQIPDCIIRLVGRPTSRIERLAHESVVVVGEVADVAKEYARAAISVVPIRYGSGTRIKILESFSRRVPVVSTSVGKAGLDLEGEKELLIADTPSHFADACIRLLRDRVTREALAERASFALATNYGQQQLSMAVRDVLKTNYDTI